MNEYYVYAWYRCDTNVPFYIGKGKRDRARDLKRRNKLFLNLIKHFNKNNIEYKLIFYEENLDELTALTLERLYINYYRYILHIPLSNFTDGGDGGHPASFEGNLVYDERWHKLLSEYASKRVGELNPFYGHRHTEETKRKLSEINTGKKHKPQTEKQKKAASEGNKKGFCVLFSDNHKEVYSSRAEAVNNLSNRYSRFNDGVFRKFLLEDVKVEVEPDYYIVGIYRLTDKKKNVLIDIDTINFDGNLDSLRTYAVIMKTIVATFNNGNELKFNSVNDCKEYFMTNYNISQYNMKKYLKSGEEFSIGNNESVYFKYTK